MLFCRLLIFFKINLKKNVLGISSECQTFLDPDQAQQNVVPDLGPNSLRSLSVVRQQVTG